MSKKAYLILIVFTGHYSQRDKTIRTIRLGECFLFSIEPKMAVFHSTGKDENFQMLSSDSLALGGSKGTKTGENSVDCTGYDIRRLSSHS